jgi:hypothetical protein
MKKITQTIVLALCAASFFTACTKSREAFKSVIKANPPAVDVIKADYSLDTPGHITKIIIIRLDTAATTNTK